MYNADYKIYALGRDRNKIVSRFGNKVVPIVQNIVDKLPMNVEYDYIIHVLQVMQIQGHMQYNR